MKKIIKSAIVMMIVLLSSVIVACGKEEKTPNVNPKIEYDNNFYYTTNQTLNDVIIKLSNQDTAGKIGWTDPSLSIKMGVNEYEWEFVPSDDNYKSTSSMIEILGYKIVNYTGIDQITLNVTGQDLKNKIVAQITDQIGADCVVSIAHDYTTDIVESGEYVVPIKLTAKEFRLIKIFGEPSSEVDVNVNVVVGKSLPSVANIISTTYNGKSQRPNIAISNLEKDVEYTLSYEYSAKEGVFEYQPLDIEVNDFVNAGVYKITIKGKGNYFGKIVKQYTIKKKDFSSTIDSIDNAIYNGRSQTPNIVVDGVNEKDYSLSYFYRYNSDDEFDVLDLNVNCFVNVGEYKIVLTPSENYTGNSVSAIYKIECAQLSDINTMADVVYSGVEQKPTLQVGDLIENIDYIVKGWAFANLDDDKFVSTNNPEFVNAGKYKVTIEGKENYAGEKTAIYTINRKEIFALADLTNVTFDGESHKPNVSIENLVANVDYALTYKYGKTSVDDGKAIDGDESNFVNAGYYTVVATGIGNYCGQTQTSFQILKADNELLDFVVTGWEYGENPIDVIATAKAGLPIVNYYKDSELNVKIDKPSTTTPAGKYYVKVFVVVNNYNDFESDVKELVIAQSVATVDSAESLVSAIPNVNYASINIVGSFEVIDSLTIEKPVVINENITLTISSNVTFDSLLNVEGKLVVDTNAVVFINQDFIFVANSIVNNGYVNCNITNLQTLKNAVNVANNLVLMNNIVDNDVVNINDSECRIDLNGFNITGIKFLIEQQTANLTLTITNSASQKAKITNYDIVFDISGGENLEVNLSNLTVESTTNDTIKTQKDNKKAKITIENCEIVASKKYVALNLKANYNYNLTNTNITGGVALAIFAGDLTMNNSAVRSQGELGEVTANEDKLPMSNDAIMILNYNYAPIQITLSNVDFEGIITYLEDNTTVHAHLSLLDYFSAEEFLNQYGYELSENSGSGYWSVSYGM